MAVPSLVASAGAWMTNQRLRFALGVTSRTQAILRLGEINAATIYRNALSRQRAWQQTLERTFEKVDVIALPTLKKSPLGLPLFNPGTGFLDAQVLQLQNTAAVN